ncbi:MAG: hypothetical protein HYY06_15235 [Deltaproteobacteria bacterium]|nr:hypothetical protein [Deltaproteobacteria bacterium]
MWRRSRARRAEHRPSPALLLAASLVLHGALLLTLPKASDAIGTIDDDLVPISAELLRAANPEPGDPREGSAAQTNQRAQETPPPPEPVGTIVREKVRRRPHTPRSQDPDGGVAQSAVPDGGTAPAQAGDRRTRGLAARLPTNVRFAVIARPALLAGSPHEEAGRETIRRAIGMRVRRTEDGGTVDPLASLEEIVVVTANPFQPGNFTAAAAGAEDASPPGFERRGGQLVRKATPAAPRPGSDGAAAVPPAPRFAWRNRLLTLADPTDGSPKPVVALVGNDLTSLTFGRLDVPIPPRIDLVAFEREDHGAIAKASATFDTEEAATRALSAWQEELASRCRSLLLAAIGLGAACRRVELTQEGATIRGTLAVERDEVQAVLGVLQTAMRSRRRPRPAAPVPQ